MSANPADPNRPVTLALLSVFIPLGILVYGLFTYAWNRWADKYPFHLFQRWFVNGTIVSCVLWCVFTVPFAIADAPRPCELHVLCLYLCIPLFQICSCFRAHYALWHMVRASLISDPTLVRSRVLRLVFSGSTGRPRVDRQLVFFLLCFVPCVLAAILFSLHPDIAGVRSKTCVFEPGLVATLFQLGLLCIVSSTAVYCVLIYWAMWGFPNDEIKLKVVMISGGVFVFFCAGMYFVVLPLADPNPTVSWWGTVLMNYSFLVMNLFQLGIPIRLYRNYKAEYVALVPEPIPLQEIVHVRPLENVLLSLSVGQERRWDDLNLRTTLSSPELFSLFFKFTESEFSNENPKFYEAVTEYKGGVPRGSFQERVYLARTIYSTYIPDGSPFQVNLPSSTFQKLESDFGHAKMCGSSLTEEELAHVFDQALDDIYFLMKRDSFVRFTAKMRRDKVRCPEYVLVLE